MSPQQKWLPMRGCQMFAWEQTRTKILREILDRLDNPQERPVIKLHTDGSNHAKVETSSIISIQGIADTDT